MTFNEELIEKSPFLRVLPLEAIPDLLGRMKEIHFEFGDVIVSEGEPADAFYLLTNGRARVLKITQSGKDAPLQRMRRGDSFGEIGLLSGGPRTASIRASEPTTVLKLEREDFEAIITQYPQMKEFVELQLQNRMLQGFLQQYTRFARTPLPVLQRILQFLKPVTFQKGEFVIREDDPGGSVYIVEHGRLTVYRGTGDEKKILAYLRPGDYFGELSLLEGMKRSATVEAATDCKLHRLAPDDWESVLDEYSELKELVQEKVSAYKNASAQTRVPLDFSQAPENVSIEEEKDDASGDPETEETASDESRNTTKFRFIRQIDDNDCGVAAFSMICRHFGKDISSSWLRKHIGTNRDGSSAKDICKVAKELGLDAKLLKKTPEPPFDGRTPCMLHFLADHWVMCLELRSGKYRIADPADGGRWMTEAEVMNLWSGHLIEFESSVCFREHSLPPSSTWQWLTSMLKSNIGKVALVGGIMVLIALGESMFPVFAQFMIDSQNSTRAFRWQIMGIGSIFIAILGLLMLQRSILSKATLNFDKDVHDYVLGKILKLPLLYFLQRSPADLQRRLTGVREISNLISIKGMAAFNSGIQLMIFTGVMFCFHWKLTLAFLAIMAPVYVALIIFSGRILRPAYETLHEMDASFSTLQDEILQGIVAVKASGREDEFKTSILKNMMHLDRKQVMGFFNVSIFNGITEAVWITAGMIFLWVVALLWSSIIISTGTLVALIILVLMMYGPVQSLVNFWADLQSAALLSRRLSEVIEWPAEQYDEDTALKPAPTIQGKVEFRDVTIQHGGANSRAALSALNFTALPGQLIAIVGRSGSGKTVLSQTIASLLHPSSGTVLYDGVAANEIRLQDLRKQVGLVLKRNRIFAGSVTSNIAFGISEVDDTRVAEVCRLVGITEQINQLPYGMDTVIEEYDHNLSGTLRQGIALARALYSDPSILVLDQISSPLDVETESTFFENLEEAFKGRLVFVATKKLSLARRADMILVLDRGKLVEVGKHDDLMSRRGLYYHMAGRREH